MRWSFGIGRIAGIRIEIHVTFLLFVAWLAITQGGGELSRTLVAAVLILSIFACVLLHELGHAFAARRYGIATRDITLLPFGGLARLTRMPDKPQHEIVIALAGPAVNLAIAVVLFVILVVLQQRPEPLVFGLSLLGNLLAANVFMLLFNLIPAFPMDGGRVLRAGLALRLPYVQATRVAAKLGQGIALVFAVVGFFGIPGVLGANPMLVFIALFVFLAASEENALVRTRSSLSGLPARAAMLTEFDVIDADAPLQRAVDLLMGGSQQDFPVVENGNAVGVLTRADLIRALQSHGANSRVGDVVDRNEVKADPHEPLEDVLQRMREHQRSALPVVSRGGLVGLLTLENVSELLLVQDALRRNAAGR